MVDKFLTIEHIKKAIEINRQNLPAPPMLLPIHESLWEDYKNLFSLTDEQMDKWFIKTQWIK